MKKTLILAFAMLLSLAACKKDNSTTNLKPLSTDLKQSTRTVQQNRSYADLTLVSGTGATYTGSWWGIQVTVQGPFSWDTQKYPSLVNGVPLLGASISCQSGSLITSQNSGPDGNLFGIAQYTTGLENFNAYQTDLDKYHKAVSDYQNGGSIGTQPIMGDYIKNSYTSGAGVFTTSGKLIRVTTGSNVAIATADYPLPTAIVPSIPSTAFFISDPDNTHHPGITYDLYGDKGKCISAIIDGTSTHVVASSDYTYVGSGVFHFWGTIIRPDGSSFSFDSTANPS